MKMRIPRTDSHTSRRMKAVRQRNNANEREIRSNLHRIGLRFRIHAKPIAEMNRTADVLFPAAKVAVFIHGCFWHGCPKHGTWPKRNAGWWRDKIQANQVRDKHTVRVLKRAGWIPITVWEHESPQAASNRISRSVMAQLSRNGTDK